MPKILNLAYYNVLDYIKFYLIESINYERPLYIHTENIRTGMNMTKFEDKCFEPFNEKIWKIC